MATQLTRNLTMREGEDLFLVDRITRPDGSLHVPGDFPGGTPVVLKIWDRGANAPGTPVYAPAAMALGSIVVSPAVVDGLWEGRDSTGYNFIFRLKPSDYDMVGGKIYDVEFQLTGAYAALTLIKDVCFRVTTLHAGVG